MVRLGDDLEEHLPTRDALSTGAIRAEQARAIIGWVDKLPDTIDAPTRVRAEHHLLDQARQHDAKALNRLGRHLFEVIAPDQADAHEAAILEREEAAAAKACHRTMYDDGHGRIRGTFTLPTYHGAALRKMLHALMAPRHRAATQGAGVERRPTPEAMGRALCELIERYPAHQLPHTDGISATMVVLIDLGRRRRLYAEYQRLAMFIRDRGCRAEGCDRTTGLHAHHRHRWTDGGRTDLATGITLCSWHHHRAHDTNYRTTHHPNGTVTYHRRT